MIYLFYSDCLKPFISSDIFPPLYKSTGTWTAYKCNSFNAATDLAQTANAPKHWLCFCNPSLLKVTEGFLLSCPRQEKKRKKNNKVKQK